MFKTFIKFFSFLLILLVIFVGYLSFYGIETKSFNKLIQNEISKSNNKIKAKFDKVKILLKLSNLSVNIKVSDVVLMYNNREIQIKDISTNLSLRKFLNKEFGIKNAFIESKDNDLIDVVNFVRIYKNSPQLIIFEKMLKKGKINSKIELNFNENGKLKKDYKFNGSIKEAQIRFLNKGSISDIDLNFDIQNKLYLIQNAKITYKNINFLSKKINIIDKQKYFLVEGNLNNKSSNVDKEKISIFFKQNLGNFNFNNTKISSDNNFSFKINKKLKINDFSLKSKVNLDKLNYKIDTAKIHNYIPNYNGFIDFEDHEIEVSIKKKKLSIKGAGSYLIDTHREKINYDLINKDGNLKFQSKININKNPLYLGFLNYKKKENENSTLFIDGEYQKDKTLLFKKISLNDSKNNFLIDNLSLSKDLKINYFKIIDLNFINENNNNNEIFLRRDKKDYLVSSKIFDGSTILDEILTGDNNEGISRFFNNLNSKFKINMDKVFIDDSYFLKSLQSDVNFKKNNLVNLNLSGNFADNKKLVLTIRTNENNEKITTLVAENAKPLVKKYKFIKGFEGGYLDFYSIKKNNLSKSKLKINDFKLKEVPALTKILTLASLQGIADLLTGEGIRFDDFEMNFENKKNLMTINEIYSIGPAISILMEGYIEGKNLVSLRGTLVPATTINKAIGKIPILGEILVGKKTGEGVFGVSFKIKGHPKKLKTTVNPIKTLAPRFITRTLEKIKKK
tara:strand:+ start:193 stop:2397 length:2205 start_codon:yes stop_codon:yes gene_type:complete